MGVWDDFRRDSPFPPFFRSALIHPHLELTLRYLQKLSSLKCEQAHQSEYNSNIYLSIIRMNHTSSFEYLPMSANSDGCVNTISPRTRE